MPQVEKSPEIKDDGDVKQVLETPNESSPWMRYRNPTTSMRLAKNGLHFNNYCMALGRKRNHVAIGPSGHSYLTRMPTFQSGEEVRNLKQNLINQVESLCDEHAQRKLEEEEVELTRRIQSMGEPALILRLTRNW